jgi:peptide/nickel transport system substrate-binding protein
MPAFSPKIGTSSLTPYEAIWKRWYKRHKVKMLAVTAVVAVVAVGLLGWWLWQGQYMPAKGGSVTEGLVGQPNQLNPLFASDNLVDAQLTPLMFRGLLKYNDRQQLVSDLASSWQKSPDGKTYTLALGSHDWHDGQPVTADDVAFTIKLTQDSAYHGSWSKSFTDVQVAVQDNRHIQLTLKEPYAPFTQSLTMGILPKHILDGKSIEQLERDPFNARPIGSGSLKFQSLKVDDQTHRVTELRLTPVGGYLDSVAFSFYDTTEAMITDFKLGKIQLLGGTYDPTFDDLADFPDKQQKSTLLKSQSYGLFFNLHNQPMNDLGLRQALAYAVPKNQLISEVLNGQAVALDGVFQPDFWAYSDRAEKYAYNEQTAKDIWAKVEAKPQTIRLLIPDKPVYQQVGAMVGRAWQKLGLNVTVVAKSAEEMGDVVNAHQEYDIVLLGEQSDIDPDRYSTWHSTQMPPAGLNITGESNKRVDKALEDGRKDLSDQDRIHDYDLFQYYLAKDVPVIWLYQPKYVYIWSNKVKGVKLPSAFQDPQDRFASVNKWYVKTQRRD